MGLFVAQFYTWWLKPDKKTKLKPPKVHTTSYFSVMPLTS